MNYNQIHKRFLSLLLSIALVFSIFSLDTVGVSAAEGNGGNLTGNRTVLYVDSGNITIAADCYDSGSGSMPANPSGYVITQHDSGVTATTHTVTISGGSQDIILSSVNIRPNTGCAYSIEPGATVNLTMEGTNTLKSVDHCAGLQVPEQATLTVTDRSTGSLTATGGSLGAAGIGGGYGGAGGAITVSGGTVTAIGCGGGAGIGGGYGGNAGTTNITGGSVKAVDQSGAFSVSGAVTDGNSHTEHCVTVTTGFGADSDVTCSINGAKTFSAATDSASKLYLWMPDNSSAVIPNHSDYYSFSVGSLTDNSTEITLGGTLPKLDINDGSITFTNGTITQNGKSDISSNDAIITGSSITNTVTVSGGTHNIILDNVNIQLTSGCAFSINPSATVNLILEGANTLKSGEGHAGLEVPCDSSNPSINACLMITSFSTGSLTATGGTYGAGIGGGCSSRSGNISIFSGTITATGNYGAGIGGGSGFQNGGSGCDGGNTCIYGGSITATGNYGAGIGGGSALANGATGGDGRIITIRGGTVNAIGKNGGAGIGGGSGADNNYGDGGDGGSSGNITVTGGNITATGGNGSAGIGGGKGRDGKSSFSNGGFGGGTIDIEITGGSVTASGGDNGVGIGGGEGGNGDKTYGKGGDGGSIFDTEIDGGLVTAIGGSNSAGIGGGNGGMGGAGGAGSIGSAGAIIITGGSVNANSISGTPINNDNTTVYLTTITLPAPTAAELGALAIKQGGAVSYGINGMKTDSKGKLYLYLPAYANSTTADLTVGGTAYSNYHGTVRNSATITSPNVLKMNQSTPIVSVNSFYDYGDLVSPTVTGDGNGAVLFSYTGTGSVTYPNVGSYLVTATKAETDAYNASPASIAQNFSITAKNLLNVSVEAIPDCTYTGNAIVPDVTMKNGSMSLIKDTDYSVSYNNNTNAGTAAATVTGKGNYTGIVSKNFAINKAPTAVTLSPSSAKAGDTAVLAATVTGVSGHSPTGTVTFKDGTNTLGTGTLTNGETKYTWNNVPAGTHTLTAEYAGDGNYADTVSANLVYDIHKKVQTALTVSGAPVSVIYGGSGFALTVTGGSGSGALNYAVTGGTSAAVDTAGYVTITGAGDTSITVTKSGDSTYNEAQAAVTIHVQKGTPTVQASPTASSVITGSQLYSSAISGGVMVNVSGVTVCGSFAWANPTVIITASGSYKAIFTPTDTVNYNTVSVMVQATVNPAPEGSHQSSSSETKPEAPTLPTVLTDIPTSTTVDLTSTTFPAGVTSVTLGESQKAASDTSDKQASNFYHVVISDTNLGIIGIPVVYDLKLLDQNGNPITGFTGKVKVKIPIPQGIVGTPHVFRYEESTGTFTDMGAIVENGFLTFETDHFSYYAIAGTGNSITLDTKTYTMPVKGRYQIGLKFTGTKSATSKVYSTNDKIATVTKLKNGNYQVTGVSIGTAYIMFDVYDNKNKFLTHASVKVTVQNGVKPNGNSARQLGIF